MLAVDTFKNFQANETVKKSTSTGATVGTVGSGGFFANTIGYHVVQVANTDGGGGIQQGDEIVGMRSGAFGVVKKILNITASNTYDHSNGSVLAIEKLSLCKLQRTLQQMYHHNSMLVL